MTDYQGFYRGIISVISFRAGQVVQYLTKIVASIKKPFPSPADLQEWKEVFAEATADPDFTVIAHYEDETTKEIVAPAEPVKPVEEVKKPRRGEKRPLNRRVKRGKNA
jgi:hypothetical protein